MPATLMLKASVNNVGTRSFQMTVTLFIRNPPWFKTISIWSVLSNALFNLFSLDGQSCLSISFCKLYLTSGYSSADNFAVFCSFVNNWFHLYLATNIKILITFFPRNFHCSSPFCQTYTWKHQPFFSYLHKMLHFFDNVIKYNFILSHLVIISNKLFKLFFSL